MFDIEVLGYVHPMTVAYVNHLLQPYIDSLSHIDSIESLNNWIEQIEPEKGRIFAPI